MRISLVVAAAVAVSLTPMLAEAQRRPARRQAAIEIRGVVPTPQVVTVRPREVPAYSRQVLVPNFYDHDFWQSLLPAYQLVPQRMITGSGLPRDTVRTAADSAMRPGATTPATTTPAAARDTTRRAPGTTPARPPR
jgi:hypothetical protein